MTLTLIGSYTSPFVRKIRLLLWNDKTVQFQPLNYFEEVGNKMLREKSPFNQLPILMDGDQPIYETRVMFNYIAKKQNLKPLTMDEENILSAIDAIISSGVNLFSLKKGGMNVDDESNYFLIRQKQRIPNLLKFITPWAAKQQVENNWNYLTMSMVALIDWIEFREVYNLKDFPELRVFRERFNQCPGVVDTNIPKA
ncbi:MAG: glutathione S-transferase family protein [Rhizobacter sp.]|nr:glutathione S-transferase family protein [Bacteriovorax sp.]